MKLADIMNKFYSKNANYRFDLWMLPWIKSELFKKKHTLFHKHKGCRHILFCVVDHFEPGTGGVDAKQSLERFNTWIEMFPKLANNFCDADGHSPQHTFFFPPHYYSEDYIRRLSEMNWKGMGEVELHLHHQGDTSETLKRKIENTLDLYSKYGIFLTKGDPVGRNYGFIHGNWALDNSVSEYCGVNNELSILKETGCYSDFTFPSLGRAQPRMINTIYRAHDDPFAPKSYDSGNELKAGKIGNQQDLMLIQGPIGFRRRKKFPWLAVEDSDITGEAPGLPERVRGWVRTGIHVKGKPEWIFIKVHTHGAVERHRDALLGQGAQEMFTTLCQEYNDGEYFKLHFVNAREMYNIARAAEDGLSGNPGEWRNYEIPPYLSSKIRSNRPYNAKKFIYNQFEIAWEHVDPKTHIEFKEGCIRFICGCVSYAAFSGANLKLNGEGFLLIGIKNKKVVKSGDILNPFSQRFYDGKMVDVYRISFEKTSTICIQLL